MEISSIRHEKKMIFLKNKKKRFDIDTQIERLSVITSLLDVIFVKGLLYLHLHKILMGGAINAYAKMSTIYVII